MRKLTIGLSVASLAFAGSVAFAAHQHGDHKGKHNPDANGDGIVTQAESQAQADKMWTKLDANGDGVINADDKAAHKAMRAERRAEKFAKKDADGNGEISLAEMEASKKARLAERFAKLDADGSGGLSQEELKAGHEMRRSKHDRKGGKHGMRKAHRMLKMADTDGDKSVSRAEYDAAVAARFAKVDTDGDGSISKAERDAAKAKMRERREERRAKHKESGETS